MRTETVTAEQIREGDEIRCSNEPPAGFETDGRALECDRYLTVKKIVHGRNITLLTTRANDGNQHTREWWLPNRCRLVRKWQDRTINMRPDLG